MDPLRLALTAAASLALLQVFTAQPESLDVSLGPFRPVSEAEEGDFELLWVDDQGRAVLEGPRRTRMVHLQVEEVLRGLSRRWTHYLVDEASTGSGTGTADLWVRSDAVVKSRPSSTWAFHAGAPVRTRTLVLRSGRTLEGILGEGRT